MNAFFVTAAVAFFLVTNSVWIMYVLTADFFIRAFLKPKYSPLGIFSTRVLSLLKIEPKLVNAGPKIFAAKIGFIFCVIIIAFNFGYFYPAAAIAGGILIFCAALEAFAGYCVGCKMYSLIYRLFIFKDYGKGI